MEQPTSPPPTPPEAPPARVQQAPWRQRVQIAAVMLVLAVILIAVGGLYLVEASRAGTAGRDVQRLEARRNDLIRANDILRSEIAGMRSISALEERALEMGFRPATVDDLQFVPFDENPYTTPPTPAPVVVPIYEIPAYNETLAEWLLRTVRTALGETP